MNSSQFLVETNEGDSSIFLDKLSPKIKIVFSEMNKEALGCIIEEYSPVLINHVFDKLLQDVLRWKSESYNWLKEYETNKNHVLSGLSLIGEFRKNFPELEEYLDFVKNYETFTIHDIGECGPGDRTHEDKRNADQVTKDKDDKLERRVGLMLIGKLEKHGIGEETIDRLKKQYLEYEEHKFSEGHLEENFVKFIDTLQGFLYVNFIIIDEEILNNSTNPEILNRFEISWTYVEQSYKILSNGLDEKGYNLNILGDLEKIKNYIKGGDKEGLKLYLESYNPNIMSCIKI